MYDSDNFLHLLTLQCMDDMLRCVISHLKVHYAGGVIRMDNFGHITKMFLSTYVHDYYNSLHLVNSPMYG